MATRKKLALVALNSKVGMRLILDCYLKHLSRHFDTFVMAERSYEPCVDVKFYGLTDAGSHRSMLIDALNPMLRGRIGRILAEEAPDLVYIVSAHPLNPAVISIAGKAARRLGKRITTASHIHDVIPHRDTRNAWIINSVQSRQIRASDYVTVYGETLRSLIAGMHGFPKDRVHATFLGGLRTEPPAGGPTIGEEKYVSFLGRIDRYKGVGDFIALARRFSGRKDVAFYIGGKGDLAEHSDDIKSMDNLRVDNRFLENAEIDAMMRKSYAVVMPYVEASQSGVVPVAYYNGCPVIVTRVGGLPEVVRHGETGFLVDPGDVEAMARHLDEIISDPGLSARMRAACYDYYIASFDWEPILDSVAGFLLERI